VLPPSVSQTSQLLDSNLIPRFTNQLNAPPPIYTPTNITDNIGNLVRQEYSVKVSQFTQQILPAGFPATKVWGYQGDAHDPLTGQDMGSVASTPGCTFEAIQGVPVQVKWINNLVDNNGAPLSYIVPVDTSIHWANPNSLPMDMNGAAPNYPPGNPSSQSPSAIVTHLHGGEVPSTSDGHPEAWWTPDGKHGPAYSTEFPTEANAAVNVYPNMQQPSTLWYHDHALGLTRLNVLSGLAGFYLIRDTNDPTAQLLPSGEYDMPLAIQDRSFYTDGSLYYPPVGTIPDVHPYWQPTFLGNTILVNGQAWPNIEVKQGQYRLRILDGSNSRFYELSFSNGMSFTQIGSDGGYLKTSAQLNSKIIGPGERIDILVDFTGVSAGEKVVLLNTFESGQNSQTTGQIMQFTLTNEKGVTPQQLPVNLNPTLNGDFPTLASPVKQRILTFTEIGGLSGTQSMLLDGQLWSAPVSESPTEGSTEDWIFVNPLMDTHTIHLHLVQFQIVSRQRFDISSYLNQWELLNGSPPFTKATQNVPSLDPFLTGTKSNPTKSEQGWKDTVIVGSGEVVTIRARWADQNGNSFPFDATTGPGYVWHCHILEHEDNEMMRPYIVVSATSGSNSWITVIVVTVVVVVAVLFAVLFFKRLQHRSFH
jgi:FtsP/CotA-like multicopper oxidase with cupredoxin domain